MTGRSLFAAGDAKESRARLTSDQEVEQKVEEVQQSVLMRQWDDVDDDELQREMARLIAQNSQLESAVQNLRVSHEQQAGEEDRLEGWS